MTAKRMTIKLLSVCLLAAVLLACGSRPSENYAPKPKGFPRIDLPTAVYQPVEGGHPYLFEVNKLAVVRPDSFAHAEPHWIFISYPQFGASIQLTYKPVGHNMTRLRAYLDDAYKLAAKHNVKAEAITERPMRTKTGLTANLIELSGEVPSQLQFITTDTTTHFLRGALYFNTATQNDSLAPVIQYIKQDVIHLLNTSQWRK